MVGALDMPVTPKELQNSADLCNGNTLRRKHQVCGGFFVSFSYFFWTFLGQKMEGPSPSY